MLVCDRCGNKAKYNTYVFDGNHDLCRECYKKLETLHEIFRVVESDFMKKKLTTIKHFDFE